MKFLAKTLAAIIALALCLTAIRAYFIISVDATNGIVHDGLGRVLTEPPLWAQLFITSEHEWAGLGWHLLDIAWFFGGMFIAYLNP